MIKDYLEYQTVDYELYKLEREIRESDERKTYAKYKKAVQEETLQIQKLNAEAEDLLNGYKKLEADSKACRENIEEIEEAAKDATALEELKFYQSKLLQLAETENGLEKEIARQMARIDEIMKAYSDTMERGKLATAKSKEAKVAYDNKVATYKDRMDELNAQLDKLKPKLTDEKLTEHYFKMREDKKMPVFVKTAAGSHVVCKCGIEVLPSEMHKLKEQGYIECSNCRRILYVE